MVKAISLSSSSQRKHIRSRGTKTTKAQGTKAGHFLDCMTQAVRSSVVSTRHSPITLSTVSSEDFCVLAPMNSSFQTRSPCFESSDIGAEIIAKQDQRNDQSKSLRMTGSTNGSF